MASRFQWQCISATILILGIWAYQAMPRKLHGTSTSPMSEMHEQWMAGFGRVYKDAAEKELRFKIFRDNVKFIQSFNRIGDRSYNLSINQFADITNEEFRASRNGYRKVFQLHQSEAKPFRFENTSHLPYSMDWRKKGAVTPIKDQGDCGCCWAFSAVAAVEGLTRLKTGKLISLSEQELVDCDTEEDEGCEGGLMDFAFKFIKENGGLTTEANYPYKGVDETCKTDKALSHVAKISGYEDVPANSEASLLKAVAHQPVSVAIDASGSALQFYSGGVFTGECGTDLDHGVTAVGYGETEDGMKYWLVKNSWGTNWGEEGYVRMQRNVDFKEGLCGIALQASYPTA